jgi:16S rRNA (uracil1498-N3)-methyltransferase
MRRFFIEPSDITKDCATISDQEARHISMVLRLRPGNVIELFDGSGMVYQAEITKIGKMAVETKILARHHYREQPPFLSVAQALVKGKKMDLIIQKATELGITAIMPVLTQHCAVPCPPPDQINRWQRIALEACKQCDRPTPLHCPPCTSLPELLARSDAYPTKIICWENEATVSLHDLDLGSAANVLLLIGPEGGFSQTEAESAMAYGFTPVSLGPRILRAETAAIATMAIIQFVLGNLATSATTDAGRADKSQEEKSDG